MGNKNLWLGAAAALLTVPALAQQQDFSAVQIETQRLTANLFMLIGSGGNIALSTGADGSVLVDTQFAQPTAEFDSAWGQGFMNPENFTRFSYQSLKN